MSFLDRHLWQGDRLLHSYKDGEAKVPAFLDDVAALGLASVDLFEATFDPSHLDRAERLAATAIDHFRDPRDGGFFYTADDHEALFTRTKPAHDGSVPAGNSMAAQLCLRLYHLTEEARYLETAERVLRLYAVAMKENPFGHANLLAALDFYARKPKEVVIVARGGAREAQPLLAPLHRHYVPNQVVYCYDPKSAPSRLPPFAREKPMLDRKPTAYVCHAFTCSAPVTEWSDLRSVIEARS
jgi:uncharacterized protein YyaL (SSP411 family)